ncbi:uncharacterized protein At5g43822 isoform X2 [Tripterygium wilfordii]|uniref:uncharacterized protein At5g43822 isoform X2 n=1 Tax=Tripterygium wilfordii TaxID=458696 RepID=UPI0018F7F3AB|nr:uncharacterized protein At5g43822 isoform X2 [Tripterygium wilfordii]
MEAVVKKYQQNFKKVREKMDQWEQLQGLLVQQFRNASSIIERLETIQDLRNYGTLNCVDGIEVSVFRKQLESLEIILLSMKKTMEEMRNIVDYMEKMHRNSGQLIKVGSSQPSSKQLHNRIGVKPCLADCLDGLRILYDMHHSEYLLKSSIVSALSSLALKPSASDLGALLQLLVDQPNIPKEEGGWKLYNSFLTSYLRRRSVEFIGFVHKILCRRSKLERVEAAWTWKMTLQGS